MSETQMTPEQRATLANLVGSGAPAATALVLTLAEAVRDRREHVHEPRDDIYCANLTSWLGERMAPVLRRLVEAEAEVDQLRSERDRYRIAWRGARTRALSTAFAADRAIARREALQRVADDLLEQFLTAQMQRDELRAELATRPSRTEFAGRPSATEALRSAAAWVDHMRHHGDPGTWGLPEVVEEIRSELRRRADAAERDEAGKDTREGESTRASCRCGDPGCEHCDTPEWYGLPWLAWLDNEEQQAFLGEIASAALGFYRAEDDDTDVLRDVVQACATYRLIAEADHAQLTAPGPDADEDERLRAELAAAQALAADATEYRVHLPDAGGTTLLARRQQAMAGGGWSVSVPRYGGGRAWTTEGWQEVISAISIDRLFCWPDAATAIAEARHALAVERGDA
ncbi:hypothetical protein ACIGW3_26030 [Streptomyces sp. NPDC053499]|uniref:hypothetical protein n=1 Tax=Streptomyces sp. NPDC053499 TaxID=3365707 RepID=UPI0037D2E2CB